MNPTTKLRFVERINQLGERKKILQQWWQGGLTMNIGFADVPVGEQVGEWRDVQTASEQEQPQ